MGNVSHTLDCHEDDITTHARRSRNDIPPSCLCDFCAGSVNVPRPELVEGFRDDGASVIFKGDENLWADESGRSKQNEENLIRAHPSAMFHSRLGRIASLCALGVCIAVIRRFDDL